MAIDYNYFHSSQESVHKDLVNIVERHCVSEFQRPIAHHQHEAFSHIKKFLALKDGPIILDSCCGTGLSSTKLAELYPDHYVIGIDKSKARLTRAQATPKNCFLVQGNVIDLWRLFAKDPWNIKRHYLLYPNPYPKISQVKRRFYAHPVWPTLVRLAPYFELRCNWSLYAQETMVALKLLGQKPHLSTEKPKAFLSLFEKKYLESQCQIYIITNQLKKP